MEKKKNLCLRWCKMSKIKWKNKREMEQEKQEKEQLKAEREKHKGKKFNTLSTKEKDELLEILAKQAGLL